MTELMDIGEVAKILHLTKMTVFRYIKSGTLPAIRIGGVWRIKKEALDEFLKSKERRVI